MKSYRTEQLRNVALVGHGGAGKTSLGEALLFATGAITRLGKVEEGNTVSDYEPDEQRRRISISLSVLPCEWREHKINVLDTPGYADFVGEVREALRVADTAVFVVDAVGGVEVGTELNWKAANDAKLPRFIFINKIDRENADFGKTLTQVRDMFGAACIPIQVPIGAQDKFSGVVDLIRREARSGPKLEAGPIPTELEAEVASYREMMVEAVAEQDDELMTKYLEGEELSDDEIIRGLREGIFAGRLTPVLVGSALANKACSLLLDALVDLAPSPIDRGPFPATVQGKETELTADPDGPLAALVFKTSADPFVGKLTYFRVYSGTLKADSHVFNANKGKEERIGTVYVLRGKHQDPVPALLAGDIGAVTKLVETGTGDTLTARERPVVLPGIEFPAPVYAAAVHPKSKADVDKMGAALARLVEEDHTLSVRREPDTGETILSGLGESHLDVALERLKRKFGTELTTSLPRVPYKETITTKTSAEYKHKKQTGGHGQYGHVMIELEPKPRGEGFEFAERVVGGTVPKNFFPAVQKGIEEGLHEGVLAHFPLVDLRVVLYDGSYHPVDSSEMAFKIAASQALKKGVMQANPVLIEPIMDVEITVPEQFLGDILSDLNTKRGRVQGMNTSGGVSVISAQAPLAEMQRYATDLRSITQGRGTFKMTLSHYEEVPPHLAQGIIAEAKKAAEHVS
ncbi:MAG: elongation factor G [Dehalococcoidia bacterium]|nr:MAG: elongation factor G [Dehalococcoidia bacterium]